MMRLLFLAIMLFSASLQADTNKPLDNCNSSNKEIAGRGCCSWHNGQCGCRNGQVICCDGTESPTCECLGVSDDQEVLIIDSKTIEIEKSEIKIEI